LALSYPLALPTSIGIANITLSANNAVAVSSSPFTFRQQIVQHAGQRWTASVSIPPVRRDLAEPWNAFLLALNGPVGTFLLGDPNAKDPRGTATSATLTGTAGSSSPTITMTGTLLAGDYIQLGSGDTATLHKVLVDRSGNGTIEIWPSLRSTVTDATVTLTNTVGRFRLSSNQQSFSIDNASVYGISFDCVEAI
jgi:fermentation-respiration switch protein FrsA (DUF1100 family)